MNILQPPVTGDTSPNIYSRCDLIDFQELHGAEIAEHLGEKAVLPDIFSQDLAISEAGEPGLRLEELARRHQALSGITINGKAGVDQQKTRLSAGLFP